MLFGLVMTIRNAFTLGVDVAGMDRLVLINKVTLILPLPFSYRDRLRRMPGVEVATHQTWFNGAYQETTNVLNTIAVEPEQHLKIYKELKLPQDQIDAWLADRQGAIVGKDLAARYGWKLGDRVPLMSSLWLPQQPWEFNVSGIYDGGAGVDKTQFFFHYDYLDQNRAAELRDNVGWYIVKIADPGQATSLSHQFECGVRKLGSRNEDHDREGLRGKLRETNRRHRLDHHCNRVHSSFHVRNGCRQYDGPVRARTHERTRSSEDGWIR
jgi:putative ABC transport system permease protein